MSFVPQVSNIVGTSHSSYAIIITGNKATMLSSGKRPVIPMTSDISIPSDSIDRKLFIGKLNDIPCFAISLHVTDISFNNATAIDIRELIPLLDHETFKAVMVASQVLAWDKNHQYCGRCGSPTSLSRQERSKKCPRCGLVVYPRISPAIMVAIIKGDKLLLARNNGFRGRWYSVLAGFVEAGETLEECVLREVKEEVGLDVDQITYFSSQFWPFPDSLMIAFTARHAGGEIKVDDNEIKEADWFSADALPDRPSSKISISGQLIDWFEKTYR